jgi:hypothetical protein
MSNVLLKAECPLCSGHVEYEPSIMGEMIDCPHCSRRFVLPGIRDSIPPLLPMAPTQPPAFIPTPRGAVSAIIQGIAIAAAVVIGLLGLVFLMAHAPSEPTQTAQPSSKPSLAVTVENISVDQGTLYSYITGEIHSQTQADLRWIQIEFYLYDKSGARVGTARDIVNHFEAGSVWRFRAPIHHDDTVASYSQPVVTCNYGRIY